MEVSSALKEFEKIILSRVKKANSSGYDLNGLYRELGSIMNIFEFSDVFNNLLLDGSLILKSVHPDSNGLLHIVVVYSNSKSRKNKIKAR